MQNPNGLRDINIEEGGWSFACVSMYVIVKSFKQLEPLKTHTHAHTHKHSLTVSGGYRKEEVI